MTLDLQVKALEQFDVLAATGSLGRAAAELGMSQPGLSRAIRKLERDLGYEVLRRHSKGVILTENGRKLQIIAEPFIASLKRIASQQSQEAKKADDVTLGLSSTTSASLVDLVFKAKSEFSTNIKLNMFELESDMLLEAIMAGQIDSALIYNPPRLPELCSFPIATDNLIVILPPSWSSTAQGSHIAIRDLADLPNVMYSKNQYERQLVDKVTGHLGLRLQPVLEVRNSQTLVEAVRCGVGYSLVNRQSCSKEIARGSLIQVELDRPVFPLTLCITCLQARSDHLASRTGFVLLKLAVREALLTGRWAGTKSLISDLGA